MARPVKIFINLTNTKIYFLFYPLFEKEGEIYLHQFQFSLGKLLDKGGDTDLKLN